MEFLITGVVITGVVITGDNPPPVFDFCFHRGDRP